MHLRSENLFLHKAVAAGTRTVQEQEFWTQKAINLIPRFDPCHLCVYKQVK